MVSKAKPSVPGPEHSRNLSVSSKPGRPRLTPLRKLLLSLTLLALAFVVPLSKLVVLAFNSDLYSYIPLVPFISAFFVWRVRAQISGSPVSFHAASIVCAGLGVALLLSYRIVQNRSVALQPENALAFTIGAFVCFVFAIGCWHLGTSAWRTLAFPFAFLIFLIPLPTDLRRGIELFFQHGSAEAAAILFKMTGTTYVRDGFVFRFAGLTIRVAEECSGIRSSLVLFLSSLLAGQLFLGRPWARLVLSLMVIPLAIVRNGLRIFSLVWLTLNVNPNVMDSPLHSRGGPIFFLLSLVPFFLLLAWLRRREADRGPEHLKRV